MDKPMFSIIIPVYKVEKYLTKCFESVKNQTYTDFEVILIDDGSPDNCPAICDSFVEIDSRCKVIHQLNQGLSGARNTGLKAATGRYVYFLDSDDTIESNLLENVVQMFETYEVDIVGFDAVVSSADGTHILSTGKNTGKVENGVEIAQRMIPVSTVPLYCYRRDFLRGRCLEFKEKIYYEDILFTESIV